MASENAAGLWMRSMDPQLGRSGYGTGGTAAELPTPGGERRRAAGMMRWAQAQQRLAVREYRDAVRLRPRNADAKQRLQTALATLRALGAASAVAQGGPPKPEAPGRPLAQKDLRLRFLAHYNLSIRYWDLGKAKQAEGEACAAILELEKVGLPLACAEHNLEIMERVQAKSRAEERRLLEAVERSPQAIGPNYELGVHYFDKRMLLRAQAQLRWTRECAKSASALQIIEHERQKLTLQCPADQTYLPGNHWITSTTPMTPLRRPPPVDSPLWWKDEDKRARRLARILNDLQDDLDFLGGLCDLWRAENDAGKTEELQETGVRDGHRPQLLPCLARRFTQDCRACDEWWCEICKCIRQRSPMADTAEEADEAPARRQSCRRPRRAWSCTSMR